MKEKKVVKKKLKVKLLFCVLLITFLIIQTSYILITDKINSIIISGTSYIEEEEILENLNITTETKNFLTFTSNLEKKLADIEFIKNVEINKSLWGDVHIKIEEKKILFYDNINQHYVLEDNTTHISEDYILGIPTLVNYTPENLLKSLGEKLSLDVIDQSLINKISEIEYSPLFKESVVLDDERFIFKMNDGNTIHINLLNFESFSDYEEVIQKLNEKGTLYLDTGNDGHIFEVYKNEN